MTLNDLFRHTFNTLGAEEQQPSNPRLYLHCVSQGRAARHTVLQHHDNKNLFGYIHSLDSDRRTPHRIRVRALNKTEGRERIKSNLTENRTGQNNTTEQNETES